MLLLHIINAICHADPNTKHNVQSWVKTIQNTYCFCIVSYATYALFTQDIQLYIRAAQVIQWQCIFDMLLCSPDIALHHLFVLGLIYPFLTTPGIEIHTHNEISTILSSEISTIFLVLHNIIPKKYQTMAIINNVLFISSFAYTRLYMYSIELIYNESLHNKVEFYLPQSKVTILFTSLYGLFFLNIYWAAIILKTLVKQCKSHMPSFQQCESFIKYMYFTSPLASLFIYCPFTNSIYFLDIIGQGMLAISSYTYHNIASQQLIDKNVLDSDIIWYYIDDVLMIHIRCFFCILTNINLYIHLTNNLPNMHLQMGLVYFSLLAHTSSMYNIVKYVFMLKIENHILTVNGDDADKMLPIQFFQGFPILLDSLIIAFSTNILTCRNNMLVITALIFINGKVAPFYQMNHLVFHGLLLLQTIFLCQSNVETNEEILNQFM